MGLDGRRRNAKCDKLGSDESRVSVANRKLRRCRAGCCVSLTRTPRAHKKCDERLNGCRNEDCRVETGTSWALSTAMFQVSIRYPMPAGAASAEKVRHTSQEWSLFSLQAPFAHLAARARESADWVEEPHVFQACRLLSCPFPAICDAGMAQHADHGMAGIPPRLPRSLVTFHHFFSSSFCVRRCACWSSNWDGRGCWSKHGALSASPVVLFCPDAFFLSPAASPDHHRHAIMFASLGSFFLSAMSMEVGPGICQFSSRESRRGPGPCRSCAAPTEDSLRVACAAHAAWIDPSGVSPPPSTLPQARWPSGPRRHVKVHP